MSDTPARRGDLMQVLVLIKASADSEAGRYPPPEVFEAMGKFNDELVEAGVLLAAEGLTPSAQGKRVAFDGETRRVIDGPFAETRELVAGFWIWQVADLDEAVAWAMRCPNPAEADGVIELRPFYALDDIRDAIGPAATALSRQNAARVAAIAGG